MGNLVSCAHLIAAMELKAIVVKKSARVQPVTHIERINCALAVPPSVAPEAEDFLAHIIFALKYEGVNLSILPQALQRIEDRNLVDAITQSPSRGCLRKVCYLWEAYSDRLLDYTDKPEGPSVLLFDPERYITGPSVRNNRWRVDFNGLGTLQCCATVERTPEVQALLDYDVLGRSKEFIDSLPKQMMDRAINWAYLSETDASFEIEKGRPKPAEVRAFYSAAAPGA
jgi:hypothetical protein